MMPYSKLNDLPDSVKDSLPRHGQEIYMEAFNNAFDQYKNPSKRRGSEDRETVAHKVAWSAVKQRYERSAQGDWHEK
jgi:cation transport regulator